MQRSGKLHSVIGYREAAPHLVRFALFAVLYLLLVESLEWPELVMCAATAAVCVIGVAALSKHNDVHFNFDPRWLGAIGSIPREIIVDSVMVLGGVFALLLSRRASFGRFERRHPHESVPPARLSAWRAFKVAEISTAPNTYVVDIQKRGGRILVHRLAGQPSGRRPKLP